jgi:magnesium-transporting ATPase (P-type)
LSKQVDGTEQSVWQLLEQAVLWNSTAFFEKNPEKQPLKQKEGEAPWEPYISSGNVTEQGLIKFFKSLSSFEQVSAFQDELKTPGKVLLKIPFTSKRKRASIVIHQPEAGEDRAVRVFTKGGPDFLMPDVTHMLDADGVP